MAIAEDIVKFTFSGDPADPIKRHLTGLYSFDHAFETAKGEIGMPIGTGYEVFGSKSIGKSTWCYSMAGMLAVALQTNIHLADLEGFDAGHFKNILNYLRYEGNVHLTHQGTDEAILENFSDSFLKRGKFEDSSDYGIGMLDSIAAISPVAEKEGDFGGATYGRRASLMGLLSRLLLPTIHPRTTGSEKIYFLVNHWYPKVGGTKYEYNSPGGNVKNYLCGVQIHLKRTKKFPDDSYLLNGTLHKNRYGFERREFQVFMKAGVGIHKGLTALYDAASLGKVKLGKTIKIGDESLGYMKTFRDKEWENDEIFQPFYDLLKDNTVLTKDE
jgi:RecA/RadA recombinase